jgi:glycosyltransferase involved in cell wall biosynthesis
MNAIAESRTGLRVALFSGNYEYVRDGANQALNKWVAFLEQRGTKVRVYSPVGDKPAFPHAGTLVPVPSIAIPRRREYRIALGLPQAIERDLETFAPNIIHLSAPDFLGYRALRLAKAWNIPAVASVHTRFESYFRYYGLDWLEKYAVNYLRHFYGQCAEIYAPTEEMARQLEADGMSRHVSLWSRGVDGARFSPSKRDETWRVAQGVKPDEVVVLFVGRLVLEKGLKVFADTVDAVRAKGFACRVLVVGDGPEREWFRGRLSGAVEKSGKDGAG